MASSIVDRRDIDFVLYEQLGITALIASEKYSHFSKQEFDMVLDQAVKFAQNDLAPTNVDGDRIGAQWKEGKVSLPPSFHGPLQQYAQQGWVASVEEPEAGGQGLPLTLFTAAYEAFVAGNMAMSQYMTLTHGAALLVKLFGTQEQKHLYLEKLLGFEWGGTMCLTEPGAGSDLARIVTRAEKIDDRYYRITGQKCFITAGDHDGKPNIIHAVLARVDGDPEGIKGISLFIVPKHRVNNNGSLEKSNDVSCSGIEHKMGIRGAATCSLIFGDLGDCIGELLGDRCKGIHGHVLHDERGAARCGHAGHGPRRYGIPECKGLRKGAYPGNRHYPERGCGKTGFYHCSPGYSQITPVDESLCRGTQGSELLYRFLYRQAQFHR